MTLGHNKALPLNRRSFGQFGVLSRTARDQRSRLYGRVAGILAFSLGGEVQYAKGVTYFRPRLSAAVELTWVRSSTQWS